MPMTIDQRGVCLLEDFGLPDPTFPGAEVYTNGAFRRLDATGVYDPRTVWKTPHDTADSLSHFIDDWVGGAATVVVSGVPFISSKSYYTDATQTKLLATITYNRNASQACTSKVTKVYASDGVTVASTITDTYTFNAAGYPTGFTRA